MERFRPIDAVRELRREPERVGTAGDGLDGFRSAYVPQRKRAGLSQADVAKRLRQYQCYVARIESGQRRIDVVEFLEIAEGAGACTGSAT